LTRVAQRAADHERLTRDEMRRHATMRETGYRSPLARLLDRIRRR
jgi:hypothetical protein